MHEAELFPLEAVPYWVKIVILREFKGHRPTVREVSQICDRSWLAVPGVGRTALARIRQATGDQHSLSVTVSADSMSDAELLKRLEGLQRELQSLSEVLKAVLSPASKKRSRSGRMRMPSSSNHEQQGLGAAF